MSPSANFDSSKHVRSVRSRTGPKRLLAIDGTGGRTMLTLGFLERLEEVLRDRTGQKLPLAQYFDMIGGTGPGAFIAAQLAMGWSAAEVHKELAAVARDLFHGSDVWWSFTPALLSPSDLPAALARRFDNVRLSDPQWQTGLCLACCRADTRDACVFHNHTDSSHAHLPLVDCLRAALASPPFTRPMALELADNQWSALCEGRLSMAGGAALPMLFTVTSAREPFQWPGGADKLFLLSIGSGHWPRRESVAQSLASNFFDWAERIPDLLIENSVQETQRFLRAISRTIAIDEEPAMSKSGEMHPHWLDGPLFAKPALTYLRYDVELSAEGLARVGRDELINRLELLRAANTSEAWVMLQEVGHAAAQVVRVEHFPDGFSESHHK